MQAAVTLHSWLADGNTESQYMHGPCRGPANNADESLPVLC